MIHATKTELNTLPHTRPATGSPATTAVHTTVRSWAIVTLMALCVAAVFGFSYGVNNHNTYLLAGLRLLNPDFLSADWLAAETFHYHPVFAYLTLLFGQFGSIAWNFAIANFLTITISLLILHAILRAVDQRMALPATAVLFALILVTRTESIASSYLFDMTLQPSTLASAALLGAVATFLTGRYGVSGVLLGLSGYLHSNFLILGFAFFGLAHLQLGRNELVMRGIKQFAPSALLLLGMWPTLQIMSGSPDAELARTIFQEVRSPHHYVPTYFWHSFLPFIGWQILAVASLPLLTRHSPLRQRYMALYTAVLLIIAIASFLTTVVYIPVIAQLFFWRYAPLGVLLAQIVLVVRITPALANPAAARSWLRSGWRPALALAGIALVIVPRLLWPGGQRFVALAVLGGLAAVLLFNAVGRLHGRVSPLLQRLPAATIPLLLLAGALLMQAHVVVAQSSLLNGYPDAPEAELYAWARTTPADAQFVIPPRMGDFRLQSERAIVSDWKSTPILPAQLVEWYERMSLVAGVPAVKNVAQAEAGYAAIDAARLADLQQRFDLDYAVLRRPFENRSTLDYPIVFENERYIVFEVRP